MFKNLNTKILASVFLLVCIVVMVVIFTAPSFNKMAQALSSNYSKSTSGSLSATEWNNLPSDFLDLTGTHAMQGNLNMGNTNRITNLAAPTTDSDAVSRGAMNTAIAAAVSAASSAKDTSGNSLKMVCARTYLNTTNTWIYDTASPLSSQFLQVKIDTTAAGFMFRAFLFRYFRWRI